MSSDVSSMPLDAVVTAPEEVDARSDVAPRAASGAKVATEGGALVGVARRYATLLLLFALIAVFTVLSPEFMTSQNWTSLLVTQCVIAVVAFAAIFPLV